VQDSFVGNPNLYGASFAVDERASFAVDEQEYQPMPAVEKIDTET
jgi:hypothetical protein